MAPALCVIPEPGLQSLLTAVGLVRTLAADRPVVLSTETEHLGTLRRVFSDVNVTFWFGKQRPASDARAMGLDVMVLPADPHAMYTNAHVPPINMYSEWRVVRDAEREVQIVDYVVDRHGPSFLLTWGVRINRKCLPHGIPIVDATQLEVGEALDLCGVIEKAMQVHAPDCWFLTLADLLGGNCKKYCHVEANHLLALACRRKYRRRVTILFNGKCDGKKCHKI